MSAGARLIGGMAGGSEVAPEVLELFSQGGGLGELGREAQLAAMEAGIDTGDQLSLCNAPPERVLASSHRCRP